MSTDDYTCTDVQKNAMDDLKSYLSENDIDEPIECIVFGPWGWDKKYANIDEENTNTYCEYSDQRKLIPESKMNIILSETEAHTYMDGWTFYNDYGYPQTFASYIWTTNHIIWVTQNDGSTWLSSAPRNPIHCKPSRK